MVCPKIGNAPNLVALLLISFQPSSQRNPLFQDRPIREHVMNVQTLVGNVYRTTFVQSLALGCLFHSNTQRIGRILINFAGA